MKTHRIASVEAVGSRTVRMTFDDGFGGLLDLSDSIARGGAFEPLKDADYFKKVAVGEGGRSFGWNLDAIGHEIDFCPDAARIRIETQIVEDLAGRFEAARAAAE